MSWRARGKTKIVNSAKNTGTGKVVTYLGGIGRGRAIRGAILARSTCQDGKCYNSQGFKPKMALQ